MKMNGMRRIAIAVCILGIFLAFLAGSETDAMFFLAVAFILAWIIDGFGSK